MDRALADRTAALLLRGQRESTFAARVKQASDPDHWRALMPALSVGDRLSVERLELSRANAEFPRVAADFATAGYFCASRFFDLRMIQQMKVAVEALEMAGWPLVFAFAYDAFWGVTRGLGLTELIGEIIGPGYRQTANVWVHRVSPEGHSAGWSPHADNPGDRGRLSLWISLSDATLDNGCMYVVPKNATPVGFVRRMAVGKAKIFDADDVYRVIHGCRALPVPPGAVMGWDGDTIHWGSVFRGGEPRISMSLQFLGPDEMPSEYELPTFDPSGALPTFAQRLAVIAKAIVDYQHFEADSDAVRLARALLERHSA
jgi:hypothetical protein